MGRRGEERDDERDDDTECDGAPTRSPVLLGGRRRLQSDSHGCRHIWCRPRRQALPQFAQFTLEIAVNVWFVAHDSGPVASGSSSRSRLIARASRDLTVPTGIPKVAAVSASLSSSRY